MVPRGVAGTWKIRLFGVPGNYLEDPFPRGSMLADQRVPTIVVTGSTRLSVECIQVDAPDFTTPIGPGVP